MIPDRLLIARSDPEWRKLLERECDAVVAVGLLYSYTYYNGNYTYYYSSNHSYYNNNNSNYNHNNYYNFNFNYDYNNNDSYYYNYCNNETTNDS